MSRRTALAAVVLLTALGAAIRFATLGRQSFWFDELATVSLLRRSFGGMLATIPHSEATPYAYFVIAWVWTRAFGVSEVGLRSLSALLGTATIPVAYGAGTALCSRRVGVFTAALVSVEPFLVWYSQEARSYAMFVFLASLSVFFFARVSRDGGRRTLIGWSVTSGLAVATHYFAVFIVAPEAAWLFFRGRRRPAIALAAVVPVAVVAAELRLMLKQRATGESISGSSLRLRALAIPKELVVGYSFPLEVGGSVAAAVLLAIGVALLLKRRSDRERSGGLLGAALAAFTIVVPYILAAAGVDFLVARNVAAAVIPAAVCVSAGYATSRLALATGAALCSLFLAITLAVTLNPHYGRTDWRGLAEQLGPTRDTRAITVIPAIDARVWRYYLPGVHEFQRPTTRVREIAVAGLAVQGGYSTGAVRPPAPKILTPPFGFTLYAVRRTSTYTLMLYRARAPTRVSRAELVNLRLTPIPPGVLLQQPHA